MLTTELALKAPCNTADKHFRSPLHMYALQNKAALCDLLVEAGASYRFWFAFVAILLEAAIECVYCSSWKQPS